jgi:two-component system cell cycle response regulator
LVPGNGDYKDDAYGAGDDARTAIVNLSDMHGRGSPRDRHLLVQVQGDQIGQVSVIHGEKWRVGRNQDSELWIRDSGVSRNHATFTWDGEAYVLRDLDSANGTYLQGERIIEHLMQDGDVIQFGPSFAFRYELADAAQEAMLLQLYDASVTDALTGAYNREHFDSRLASELSFARRHETELSLLMLDLDHFKQVNDTYGHQAGDAVLQELAKTISTDLRLEDVFARYGGEEFAVLLRGINLADARIVAERFREKVEQLQIEHDRQVITITVSIGVASLACCEEWGAEELIGAADRRLYAAKRGGRNQVVASG